MKMLKYQDYKGIDRIIKPSHFPYNRDRTLYPKVKYKKGFVIIMSNFTMEDLEPDLDGPDLDTVFSPSEGDRGKEKENMGNYSPSSLNNENSGRRMRNPIGDTEENIIPEPISSGSTEPKGAEPVFPNYSEDSPKANEHNEMPDPSSVNLKDMDGSEEKSSPTFEYEEPDKRTADDVFNRKIPAAIPEPPVWDQKKTDTIPAATKNLLIQIVAFAVLLLVGIIFAISLSRKDSAKSGQTEPVDAGGKVIMTELETTKTDINHTQWEPGILSNDVITTTIPDMEESNAPSTENSTQVAITEAAPDDPEVPTDPRFETAADLTLYIQNSAIVIIRKEHELVQSYVNSEVDKETFLDTMATYSIAMDELSHLLVVNKKCYIGDETTYQTLENSIITGMSYADTSKMLAEAGTPLSEFQDRLGE